MSTSFGYHFNVTADEDDEDDKHEHEGEDEDEESENEDECDDMRKIRKLKEENCRLEVEFHCNEDEGRVDSPTSSNGSSTCSPTSPPQLKCPHDDLEMDKIVSKYFFSTSSSSDLEGQEEEEHYTNKNNNERLSVLTTILWNLWYSMTTMRVRQRNDDIYRVSNTPLPPPPPPKIQPRFSRSSDSSEETKSYNSNDSLYYFSSWKTTSANSRRTTRRTAFIACIILFLGVVVLLVLSVLSVPPSPNVALVTSLPNSTTLTPGWNNNSDSKNNTLTSHTYRIVDLLLQVTSKDVLLEQSQSPQNRAYRWMLDQQRGNDIVDLSNVAQSEDELHKNLYLSVYQRYAMVTFYFALGGDDGDISIFEDTENGEVEEPFFHIQSGWTNSTNWLSSESVCTWNGVTCDPQNEQVISISLPKNSLDGTLPSEIFILKYLQRLHLPHNSIKGSLPNTMESCTDIIDIDLSYNLMEGTIMDVFLQLPLSTIQTLILDYNGFFGTIEPNLFATLNSLRILSISNNEITGVLPSNCALPSSLVELDLHHNLLHGTLPSQWAAPEQQQQLMVLHLGSNADLTGSIPDSFYRMLMRLELLRLDMTSVNGTIPSWIHELDSLEIFNVSHTRMGGTISKQWGLLSSLQQLDLGGTPTFSGTVPYELCSLRQSGQLKTLVVDCGGENPSVQCDCCTDCTTSSLSS